MRDAGVAGVLRHPVELRARDVLHEHQAAGFEHVADPARAVASAARQHHRDGSPTAVLRERAEEDVDGQRQLLLPVAFTEE